MSKKQILLVDDDISTRSSLHLFLKDTLSEYDVAIHNARSGEEALDGSTTAV